MGPYQPADVLHSVLNGFPPVQHAFAYGSGVFKQPGLYDAMPEAGQLSAEPAGGAAAAADPASSSGAADQPMLDFIFAVEDPVAWHTEVGSAACLWTRSLRQATTRNSCAAPSRRPTHHPFSMPAGAEPGPPRRPLLLPAPSGAVWHDGSGRAPGCRRLLQHSCPLAPHPGGLRGSGRVGIWQGCNQHGDGRAECLSDACFKYCTPPLIPACLLSSLPMRCS